MKPALLLFFALATAFACAQPQLPLPPREDDAPGGAAFAKAIEELPLQQREEAIFKQVKQGNIPDFERHLVPVKVTFENLSGTIYVVPDFLAVGSNDDYFYVPLTPYTAQRIADLTHCTLPTTKMSDDIYAAAPLKLTPWPMQPGSIMNSVGYFEQHNTIVRGQRIAAMSKYPLGTLTAGNQKDIVICPELTTYKDNVAIYGWHTAVGKPIQPLYLKHVSSWTDYSHGERLVADEMELDGKTVKIQDVLNDPARAGLLSKQGVIPQPRYVFKEFPKDWADTIVVPADEKITRIYPMPGTRVVIDEPAQLQHKVLLVLYALPNGNTIEQTFGRKMEPGMDWHFDIQNIGAQTRFLRERLKGESVVVAYLQTDKRAWPTFMREVGTQKSIPIINSVVDRFRSHDLHVVLDSHSGGGALLFAYIHSVDAIPDNIERIAFIDSEYNYETDLHKDKLAAWLRSGNHYLSLIAYDDYSALLNGKHFVSAEGGTWGRTHLMLNDFTPGFNIARTNTTDPERYSSPDGHIVFWLKQNPNHEIFHTVQVEKNGFIESLLSGTPLEGKDYVYFGDRAYSNFIHN